MKEGPGTLMIGETRDPRQTPVDELTISHVNY